MIKLTPREKQVFEMVLARKNLEEIASKLGIGFTTAQYHLTNVHKKYGVRSRKQLIELIEGPPPEQKNLDMSPRESSLLLPRGGFGF